MGTDNHGITTHGSGTAAGNALNDWSTGHSFSGLVPFVPQMPRPRTQKQSDYKVEQSDIILHTDRFVLTRDWS